MTEADLQKLAELMAEALHQDAPPSFDHWSVVGGVVGGVVVYLITNEIRRREERKQKRERRQEERERQLERARVNIDRDLRTAQKMLSTLRFEELRPPEEQRAGLLELNKVYMRINVGLRNANDLEYGALFLDVMKEKESKNPRNLVYELEAIGAIIDRLEQKYKGPWLQLEQRLRGGRG